MKTDRFNTVPPFELPPLPYAGNALEPFISEKTLSFHYGKHHQKYVDVVNELVGGTPFAGLGLEEVIKAAAGKPEFQKLFNNAAQVWNHWFYWNCLCPNARKAPRGGLLDAVNAAFGSVEGFAAKFGEAANSLFGSGYVWLVADAAAGGGLKITSAPNAGCPLAQNQSPLLAIDVWEHAYYLDYQNRCPDYVAAYLGSLVNWEFAEQNFDRRSGI